MGRGLGFERALLQSGVLDGATATQLIRGKIALDIAHLTDISLRLHDHQGTVSVAFSFALFMQFVAHVSQSE